MVHLGVVAIGEAEVLDAIRMASIFECAAMLCHALSEISPRPWVMFGSLSTLHEL